MPGMSGALCQLSAWIGDCLKISRINSQRGLQIRQRDNPSLQAYVLSGMNESEAYPLNEVFGMGMTEGLMDKVCVCMCVHL